MKCVAITDIDASVPEIRDLCFFIHIYPYLQIDVIKRHLLSYNISCLHYYTYGIDSTPGCISNGLFALPDSR